MKPSLGRVVLYRSRTGNYTVPAIITATVESLNPAGVEAGHVPALSSPDHVHLTVFTPGKPMMRVGAEDFEVESPHGRSENVGGVYQEFDIGPAGVDADTGQVVALSGAYGDDPSNVIAFPPGTWAWPAIKRDA